MIDLTPADDGLRTPGPEELVQSGDQPASTTPTGQETPVPPTPQ
jgi:hypothetical protein